ncbi:hypothetical protein C6N75_03395 [Streptomyces solincola]|uniref:Uncharacterized protein n=1 Tax=Streptomyces solincola TaxID=2100817 RepID=A0A2S9Q1S4_9ACTN|nr:hypothetical protein [Streptomyces solincola]PRH80598.1 hypothetical protein C6N75_03395 [Streptomyces solincola]
MNTQDVRRTDRQEATPAPRDTAVLDRPIAMGRDLEGRVRWCRPATVPERDAAEGDRLVIVRGED